MPVVLPAPSTISATLAQQRQRALLLYRDWLRAAPAISTAFRIHYRPIEIRQRIRAEFESKRNVRDPQSVDVLLLKGRSELNETLNIWKQDDHVERLFGNNVYARESRKVNPQADRWGRGHGNSEFLARFYQGNYAKVQSENYA